MTAPATFNPSLNGRSPGLPFLLEFVRSPRVIGAVAASGAALTRAMIATVPLHSDAVVGELGPGTGAMTGPLHSRLVGRGRQLALEVNPRLDARLTQQYPTVEVVHGDAPTSSRCSATTAPVRLTSS